MKKITKAVIPAAGIGTRVLPATKSMPKEMFPIVDKPAIQYIVEEAVNSGITDILIITNRGKELIENHFDKSPELEQTLINSNKLEFYEEVEKISKLANIYFIRQKEAKGLGHAVLCAKSFVAGDAFAVLYGDDVIINDSDPVCGQLIRAYEEFGKGVLGVKQVSESEIHKYSSLALSPIKDNLYLCNDMVEKPSKEHVLSLFSILGRCVLPPSIFDILERTEPGAGGEIQLTDAMRKLAQTESMVAVDYVGKRYDMGNKLGLMQAAVEVGLNHPQIGESFKAYLKDYISKI